MNTSRLIVCLLFSLWLPPALAIELFRGDARSPDEVFLSGFTAPGTNVNPLAHIAGASCFNTHAPPNERTAFVATTTFPHQAEYYGDYVYRIVPDAAAGDETATFHVASALRHIEEHPEQYQLPLRQQATAQGLRNFHGAFGQHISRRIPPESIISVDRYEYDHTTGRNRFAERHLNPYYRAVTNSGSRTRFSAEMIAAMGGEPPEIVIAAAAPNGTTVSVCMTARNTCGASGPQSVPLTANGPPLVCESEPALLPGNLFDQVMDIILD